MKASRDRQCSSLLKMTSELLEAARKSSQAVRKKNSQPSTKEEDDPYDDMIELRIDEVQQAEERWAERLAERIAHEREEYNAEQKRATRAAEDNLIAAALESSAKRCHDVEAAAQENHIRNLRDALQLAQSAEMEAMSSIGKVQAQNLTDQRHKSLVLAETRRSEGPKKASWKREKDEVAAEDMARQLMHRRREEEKVADALATRIATRASLSCSQTQGRKQAVHSETPEIRSFPVDVSHPIPGLLTGLYVGAAPKGIGPGDVAKRDKLTERNFRERAASQLAEKIARDRPIQDARREEARNAANDAAAEKDRLEKERRDKQRHDAEAPRREAEAKAEALAETVFRSRLAETKAGLRGEIMGPSFEWPAATGSA